jgi:acyl transferase domain-containing protein/thioesterase domain-containing protein/acyl carrier protein
MTIENNEILLTEEELEKSIAVIGMACKFPGADSPQAFWMNILNKQESIRFFSERELINAGIAPHLFKDPNYVAARGILTDIDQFDASFFGYSVYEAKMTDPQHRVFLEQSWTALENAGYTSCQFPGTIGLFAGMSDSSYLTHNILRNVDFRSDEEQILLGNSAQFLCTKVAYALGLTGPCVTVNTACSTGLMSIALACESLISYNCDMALAGGISIIVPQHMGYLYQNSGISSPDGHCRTFDRLAQGTVSSNGCGVVVLKRLAEAISDNDHIVAVIRGWAINNDGSDKVGYTAPSVHGQRACIAQALTFSGIDPTQVDYIEAHGTGTILGDPIEVTALTEAYQYDEHQQAQYCALGSVKTNIGHTDVAAGVAGFIKAALAIQEKILPPNLHFTTSNEKINFAASPFYVNTEAQPWTALGRKYTAAVNSMGIGGTNVHLLMQEASRSESSEATSANVFVLSAKTETALETTTNNLKAALQSIHGSAQLADAAFTLQLGRKAFKWRRFIPYNNREQLLQTLDNAKWMTPHTHELKTQVGRVIFAFPGQGSQHVNMAREIYEEYPLFKQVVDNCCEQLKAYIQDDLRDVLFSDAKLANEKLRQTEYAQLAIFVIEYALASFLIQLGIMPDAMIGHSLGEYVAAVLSNVLQLEDALKLIVKRSKLMSQTLDGLMLALPLSQEKLLPLLGDTLSLAAVNAPELCVISGEKTAVLALEQELKQQYGETLASQRLHTSHAFHSALMDDILREYTQALSEIKVHSPTIPYISNLTGDWINDRMLSDKQYWANHLRHTVQFSAGLFALNLTTDDLFIEVGPNQTLTQLLKLHHPQALKVIPLLPHAHEQKSAAFSLMDALGTLWLYGKEINWLAFYEHQTRKRLPLPTYPFERKRYWIDPSPSFEDQTDEKGLYAPIWEQTFPFSPQPEQTAVDRTWLIFANDEAPWLKELCQLLPNLIVVNAGDKYRQHEGRVIISPEKKAHYVKLLQLCHTNHITVIHSWFVPDHVYPIGDFEEVLQRGPFSLLYLTQAFTELFQEKKLQGLVVASQLYQVLAHDLVSPAKATIAGPCKVIPQEQANIAFKLIDIGKKDLTADIIYKEACQISHEDFATTLAYRGTHRFKTHFKPCSTYLDTNQIQSRLKPQGVYLLTGGLGDIGLSFAEFLAKKYQANLILISRSSPSDSAKLRLNEIKQFAMSLCVKQAAVEDLPQMTDAITATLTQFGHINGVIHAAGVPGGGIAQFKTVEEYRRILQPKLYGTQNILQLLQNEPLDFVVFISSLTAVTGFPGQIDYCSANLALDAFAATNDLQPDVFCVTMNWQAWRDIGMAAKSKTKLIRLDAKSSTTAEEAHVILEKTLSNHLKQVVISGHNPNDPQINQNLMQTVISKACEPERLRQPKHDELTEMLLGLWQKVLGVEVIDIDDDFYELGGHSLLAISLLTKISNQLGKTLSPALLIKTRTIRALAQELKADSFLRDTSPVILLQQGQGKPPLFLLHPIGGTVFCYLPMIQNLKNDRMIYGIQDPSIDQDKPLFHTLEEMATTYRKAIQAVQAKGPYYLCGASFGANLVIEIAHQLLQENEHIAFAGLIDGWPIYSEKQRAPDYLQTLIARHQEDQQSNLLPQEVNNKTYWEEMLKHRTSLMLAYQVKKLPVKLTLYKSSKILLEYEEINRYDNHWQEYSYLPIEVTLVPGDHHSMLEAPQATILAQFIQRSLDELEYTQVPWKC